MKSITYFLFLFVITISSCSAEEKTSPVKSSADGLGTAIVAPANDIQSGTYHTWQITYTAAKAGIEKGGGVVFHIPPFWGWTPPQNTHPERPGFVTVTCSDPSIKLETIINSQNKYVLVLLKNKSLKENKKISLIYGNTQGKFSTAKSRSDIYAENGERFYIKVDGDGDGFFTPIKDHPRINTLSNPAVHFKVTSPSFIKPGIPFFVKTAALDNGENWDRSFNKIINISSFPEGIICRETRPENSERLFECAAEKESSWTLKLTDI